LNIILSFTEIENFKRWKFKKIVKEKTTLAAFAYLLEKKNKPDRNGKQAGAELCQAQIKQNLIFSSN
jgi:hypothetical protein